MATSHKHKPTPSEIAEAVKQGVSPSEIERMKAGATPMQWYQPDYKPLDTVIRKAAQRRRARITHPGKRTR